MTDTPKAGLSTIRYTTLRFALFFVCGAALYALGIRDFMLVLVSFGVSGIASLFLLRRQRDDMSAGLVSVFGRINKRIEDSKTAEDVD